MKCFSIYKCKDELWVLSRMDKDGEEVKYNEPLEKSSLLDRALLKYLKDYTRDKIK